MAESGHASEGGNTGETSQKADATGDGNLNINGPDAPPSPPSQAPQPPSSSLASSADTIYARSPRRTHFARAAFIGLCAGLLAVAFRQALAYAEKGRGLLLTSLHAHPWWGWAVLPAIGLTLGSLVGWSMLRWAPEAGGSGIPHLKGVLLHLRKLSWARVLPVKFFGGVAMIGSGLSMGREGPTVQMGAAVAKALSVLLRAPESDVPQLLSAGAGAGMAAAFNAPLTGLVFVVEELHRELSSRTAAGALVAAICATVMTKWLAGDTPSFDVHGLGALPLNLLPLAAVMGIVGGAGGVMFNKCLLAAQDAALRQKRVPRWALPALAGVVVGMVAWWLPDAVGGGQSVAERLMGGTLQAGLAMLVLLLGMKFLMTILSYGSGAPGGIFAPMLLLGALSGMALGKAGALAWPGLGAYAPVLAVLGMAAFFAGSVRAPLTGIVLVSEMTGGYELLFAITIAVLAAYLTAEGLRDEPIYDALLEADLKRSGYGEPSANARTVYMGIQSRSTLAGREIRHAKLPEGCMIISLERSGRSMLPAAETVIHAGDHVTFLVPGEALKAPMEIVRLCTGL